MSKDYLSSPIFVTGIERSGSSLIGRILSMCGAFSGQVTEMYENKKIAELVDNYYRFHGADPRGQYPLPDAEHLFIPTTWKENVTTILEKEKYKRNVPWFYKSSRIGQAWPIWTFAFPDAKWIIVRRRTGDIIQSCLKTAYMNAYENEEGWLNWVHEHEHRFVSLIESGANVKVVWPDRMANGDYRQIFEMLDWLGLEWNTKVYTEIAPLLQKERR